MKKNNSFKPHFLLKNSHLQTLWATLFREKIKLPTSRERINTLDHDFLDLDWYDKGHEPIVILIHGLASSSRTHYISHMQYALDKNGFSSVALNLRGCSGMPNLLASSYHAGLTDDLDSTVKHIHKKYPDRPLFIVGYSLGGNLLLKYLGEREANKNIISAVSVSAPIDLKDSSLKLSKGLSKYYGKYLLKLIYKQQLKKINYLKNINKLKEFEKFSSLKNLNKIRTMAELDQEFTAPINNFKSAQEYYEKNNAKSFLHLIKIPTLLIHSKDDPFMSESTLDEYKNISEFCILELSPHGGHVGFIESSQLNFFKTEYWLEKRIPDFFKQTLDLKQIK